MRCEVLYEGYESKKWIDLFIFYNFEAGRWFLNMFWTSFKTRFFFQIDQSKRLHCRSKQFWGVGMEGKWGKIRNKVLKATWKVKLIIKNCQVEDNELIPDWNKPFQQGFVTIIDMRVCLTKLKVWKHDEHSNCEKFRDKGRCQIFLMVEQDRNFQVVTKLC